MNVDYALAVLQIAELQDSELKAVGEKIHNILKNDFPHSLEVTSNDVAVNVDGNGRAETTVKTVPTFHRADSKSENALFIAKNQIGFHSKSFNSSEDFIEQANSVFTSIISALDINFIGRVSSRVVTNFKYNPHSDNSEYPFDNFNADRFLGEAVTAFPKRGHTSFNSTNIDEERSIVGRVGVSVEVNTPYLPVELMEIGVKVLNIHEQRINIMARIDLDYTWNYQGELNDFGQTNVKDKLIELHKMFNTTYSQLQGE